MSAEKVPAFTGRPQDYTVWRARFNAALRLRDIDPSMRSGSSKDKKKAEEMADLILVSVDATNVMELAHLDGDGPAMWSSLDASDT